ncbi:bifunctional UDP-sugar hydrolase/5'-nucleotidase UshA [Lacimicrobium sp. SS2-24]|uniref:bifunctional UDP-sugar hydrolase/5'-nucleotidase UshA n=1 Tax=Lacimicrobium sp. SS2-24 TaxID=2005569 RepID=UPI000B4BF189|nr:bifunctional UDP-sugar hydrolase/5'-nucleotidase UshA [Lacimicrobium sp. SS2-24]
MHVFCHRTLVLSSLLLILITGCAANTSPSTQPVSITILHTNDHHGRFWRNDAGEYGLAARKTLIDGIREEVEGKGGVVLLLSGGDINTGVPESDLQQAEPDFKGMRLLGYDAMALGNHEFDNPLSVLDRQHTWAGFPLLSANIYDRNTQHRRYQPYAVLKRQGLTIVVIGLTTEDTEKVGNPEYIKELEFRDAAAEAKALIADVRRRYAVDMVIAVTHMGHYDNGESGINAPGDVTLARAQVPGSLDMIIGGHSQEPVCMLSAHINQQAYSPGQPCQPDYQNGTWIMQAHEWGKYVGRADFILRNGELELQEYQLIPVNLRNQPAAMPPLNEDAQMLALLQPFQQMGAQKLNVKIAELNGRLEGDRSEVRFRQTNLGRLIAAAQMHKTHSDFGLISGGGVRDSINPGDVTYKDVLRVQPFGNTVGYVQMSGQEVLDYLSQVATKPTDSGAYAQFYNLSFRLVKGRLEDVKIGGSPLQPQSQYRFSLAAFYASGGDGYPRLTDHPGYVDTGFVDAEVLRLYMQQNSPIDASDYAPSGEIINAG